MDQTIFNRAGVHKKAIGILGNRTAHGAVKDFLVFQWPEVIDNFFRGSVTYHVPEASCDLAVGHLVDVQAPAETVA